MFPARAGMISWTHTLPPASLYVPRTRGDDLLRLREQIRENSAKLSEAEGLPAKKIGSGWESDEGRSDAWLVSRLIEQKTHKKIVFLFIPTQFFVYNMIGARKTQIKTRTQGEVQ